MSLKVGSRVLPNSIDEDRPVTEVTRRTIVDRLVKARIDWAGRMDDVSFLTRLFDLSSLASTDRREADAEGDILRHSVQFPDWRRDWVFDDERFALMTGPTPVFLKFLCETLHPLVRQSADEVASLVQIYNRPLAVDGWRLVESGAISGRPIFSPVEDGRIVLFSEPTGWRKVDRQSSAVRAQLDAARTEEHYQAVGLLGREVMITVALEVYDPVRHSSPDGVPPSTTDAKRMIEAMLAVEAAGPASEELRKHVRTAWDLAVALQHKRQSDFRTAAMCAEATFAVVNMLAVVAGRRDRR